MPGLFFKSLCFFWKKIWDHWQLMDKILPQLRCSEHCKWWEIYFINGWRIVSIATVWSCEGWWLAHTSLRGPPSDRNVFYCQMLLFWLVLSFSGCSTLQSNSDQCSNLSRRSGFLSNLFQVSLIDWHETARIYVETPRQDEDGTVLGDDGSWLQCYCEDGKGRRIPVRTLYGKDWNVSLVIFGDPWWQFWIVMVVACWHRLSLRQQGIWAYFINCETHTHTYCLYPARISCLTWVFCMLSCELAIHHAYKGQQMPLFPHCCPRNRTVQGLSTSIWERYVHVIHFYHSISLVKNMRITSPIWMAATIPGSCFLAVQDTLGSLVRHMKDIETCNTPTVRDHGLKLGTFLNMHWLL